jgi:alpha-glucosidase
MEKGASGIRIDAAGFIYENNDFLDEPVSKNPGGKPGEYKYLDHIYTMNDERYYYLINDWRNFMDEWSNSRNEEEKVHYYFIMHE